MSLRWSSYVAPKSPKGGLKNAKRPISVKIALHLKKVCYNVSLCENCQRQSCKAFIGLTNRAKNNWWGAFPCTWNFGSKWPRWSEIADFRSIFARSDSAVTPSKKTSINTNRKSTTRFQWAQDEHRTLSLSVPKGGSKTQCPKCEQAAITPKRYEIGCQLLLITSRKSHTGFRLVPIDDLEWPWTA